MESFQHVMALISVVVGLGVAHILVALGQAIHRIMGIGSPLRLDATWLFWIGTVFVWQVSFWWWEYSFSERDTWTMGLYLFVLLYAVLLFLLGVVLVPYQMENVSDTAEYFLAVRPWFFALFLATNLVDLVDTFLKGTDFALRFGPMGLFLSLLLVGVIGLVSRGKRLHLAMAVTVFSLQLIYIFRDLGVLGSNT